MIVAMFCIQSKSILPVMINRFGIINQSNITDKRKTHSLLSHICDSLFQHLQKEGNIL